MKTLIRDHYTEYQSFQPSLLVIATWEDVGHYDSSSDQLNTFQTIVATDGSNSFVLFQYADVQWIQSEPRHPSAPRRQVSLWSLSPQWVKTAAVLCMIASMLGFHECDLHIDIISQWIECRHC